MNMKYLFGIAMIINLVFATAIMCGFEPHIEGVAIFAHGAGAAAFWALLRLELEDDK